MPPTARSAPSRLCLPAIASAASAAILALAPGASAASPSVTISPLPGTPDAPAHTQISFLGVPTSEISGINVRGSSSGGHRGHLRSYSTHDGGSYVLHKHFTAGERVTVTARIRTSRGVRSVGTSFTIATPYTTAIAPFPPSPPNLSSNVLTFRSRPDLIPPAVSVLSDSGHAAPGDLFVGPFGVPNGPAQPSGQVGPMIVDNAGGLVWFRPSPSGQDALNLRVQQYRGSPVLTWWQGVIRSAGFGGGEDIVLNQAYHTVAKITSANGIQPDLHEFIITSKNTAFVSAYTPVITNLSSAGGPTSGALLDSIVQEIDLRTGLVMFEWHSLGHIPLSDSFSPVPTSGVPWDYFHINSVDPTSPTRIVISARNTWAGYDISLHSGHVVWTLGGKKTTFKMGPGAQFAWQHDIQLHSGSTVTVFDDEAVPSQAPPSRGLVLTLNLARKTATVAIQYKHPTPLLAGSQGNMQLLPNGDELVGWGSSPFVTEFSSTGQVLYDAKLPLGDDSYRWFRSPWVAQPTSAPDVAATIAATGGATVYASWDGATEVARWEVDSGASPSSLTAVTTVASHGFETAIPVSDSGPYFAVKAISAAGKALATSKTVKA